MRSYILQILRKYVPTLTPDNPIPMEIDPSHLVMASDKTQLYLREWVPENPRADYKEICILIMHGITAHSKPYEILGEPLAKMGITVYGLDLRGHGLSSGNRGDIKGIEQFHEDVKATLDVMTARGHNRVIFLGHSLGIITSLLAVEAFPQVVAGIILLSGARKVRDGVYPERSFWSKLKILFWSFVQPSRQVIHYHRDGMLGIGNPLFTFWYTLRFLRTFSANKISIPKNVSYPVFVGIGEKDELFSVESARELFDEFDVNNKEFAVFPDTYHAEFHDGSFDELFQWVESQLQSGNFT